MANEYKQNISFYAGADYGLDPNKSTEYGNLFGSYRFPASSFGFTTDSRTANQLGGVSQKVNTGAKTIEVQGVSAQELESIPDQHLTEINRLKKLVGLDLTFHGPIVEATGFKRGSNWNEEDRKQAERQMWSAVQRSHKLDPQGNIVVTFHSSNDLPEPETIIMNPKTGKEEITDFVVVDERAGTFQALQPKTSFFKSEDKTPLLNLEDQRNKLNKTVEDHNKEGWYRQLQSVSFNATNGSGAMREALSSGKSDSTEKTPDVNTVLEIYNKMGSQDIEKDLKQLEELGQPIRQKLNSITHADIYLRDAYQQLQNVFNQAYSAALKENKKEDIRKLDEYRQELMPKLNYIEDPLKVKEFAEEIVKGVSVLRSVTPPRTLAPLKDFALDKASETFSNLALNSYKEFKNTAPVISIENPPAGMGLNRGSDLRDLVKQAQAKFTEKAQLELGMSKSEAEEQAKKLIGVTWDVGHINMIRKFGYDENDKVKQISAQTKEIAPYLKHVHLSDNFGMEHTELPMGMGNVPMQAHLAALKEGFKGQLDKIKKVVETGGPWFRDFKVTPFMQTLEAFGSPIYAMQMAPYWSQASHASGGYFSGYGNMLPPTHFSMYGSGFSNIPTELGGQLSGRSRVSGNPME